MQQRMLTITDAFFCVCGYYPYRLYLRDENLDSVANILHIDGGTKCHSLASIMSDARAGFTWRTGEALLRKRGRGVPRTPGTAKASGEKNPNSAVYFESNFLGIF